MDVVGLVLISALLIWYLPKEVLNDLPATGGDMGSHYWPLHTLVYEGIFKGDIRVWNPGNLGGEPQLVHYFPFSFFCMALLAALPFVSLGMAFNLGTLGGLFGLPFAAYFCIRSIGFRFPAPLIAAAVTTMFLYNESFTMWGGNTLSTLAGQFAHGYALVVFLIAIGFLSKELREKRFPLWSTVFFSFVAWAHAYVELLVPMVLFSAWIFFPAEKYLSRFFHCAYSGIFSILLAAWYLYPMIDNNTWTTPMPMTWRSDKLFDEIVPKILWPAGILAALSVLLVVVFFFRWKLISSSLRMWSNLVLFLLVPCLGSAALYFLFPKIGLVDVRAVPQSQLFICLMAALVVGLILNYLGQLLSFILSLPLVIGCLWWTSTHVRSFPSWATWNYSGWQSKELYPSVLKVSDILRGDYSDPRAVYEHSPSNNAAGTERVFEMLPYFAGRATLESLYTQATILSPATYFLQAEISSQPSCPLDHVGCPKLNIEKARERLSLLAVGDLILTSKQAIEQAQASSFLERKGKAGPWEVFTTKEKPQYVEVIDKLPVVSLNPNWKDDFYQWLIRYNGEQPLMLYVGDSSKIDRKILEQALERIPIGGLQQDCQATTKVDYQKVTFTTTCPGKLHLVKFSYHPSWKASTGDPLFLASPGMIAMIPSDTEITLRFGERFSWAIAGWISIISTAIVFAMARLSRRGTQ